MKKDREYKKLKKQFDNLMETRTFVVKKEELYPFLKDVEFEINQDDGVSIDPSWYVLEGQDLEEIEKDALCANEKYKDYISLCKSYINSVSKYAEISNISVEELEFYFWNDIEKENNKEEYEKKARKLLKEELKVDDEKIEKIIKELI